MAFYLSPSVNVKEWDLTLTVPAVATSIIGYVGQFSKGVCNKRVNLSREADLLKQFGKPTDDNYKDFYSVSNALDQSRQCVVVRMVPSSARNAGLVAYAATTEPITGASYSELYRNEDENITINYEAGEVVRFLSKGPGNWYNDNVKIAVCSQADFAAPAATYTSSPGDSITNAGWITSGVTFKSEFDYGPQDANQFAVAVLTKDDDGDWYIVEKHIVSLVAGTKDHTGRSIYVDDYFLQGSDYVVAFHNPTETTIISFEAVALDGGTDGELTYINDVADRAKALYANYAGTVDPSANFGTDDTVTLGETYAWIDETTDNTIKIYKASAVGTGSVTWTLDTTLSTDDTTYYVIVPEGGSSSDATLNSYKYKATKCDIATGVLTATDLTATLDMGDAFYTTDVDSTDKNWWFTSATAAWTDTTLTASAFASGQKVPLSDIMAGYDLFDNAEEVDVNLLIDGANTDSTVQAHIINLCENRMDCMAIITPPASTMIGVTNAATITSNLVTWRTTELNVNSSYFAIYANWKYQYDRYNDAYRWVPISGDIAGLMAATDFNTDPWYATAGKRRGRIRNAKKLAWSPNKTYRNTLYQDQLNPVISKGADGDLVWGQKTGLTAPSAFSRVNVRRLFIVLEKAIATAAEWFLFEFNDAFTRQQFKAMVEPFLRDIQGRRGIQAYYVQCDSTNNTPEVIDRNEFVGSIYIKPNRVAEFITLNMIAVKSGVDFTEAVQNFTNPIKA